MDMARILLLTLTIALLCAAGCETTETVLPDQYGGWIEGTVSDGSLGEEASNSLRIRVLHIRDDGQEVRFETYTDEDGHYRIGVPNGRAVVAAAGQIWGYYTHDGVVPDAALADTVVIDGVLQRVDFQFGRYRVVAPEGMIENEEWRRVALRPVGYEDYHGVSDGWFRGSNDGLVAEFSWLPPGRYLAEVDLRDVHSDFFLPGTYRPTEAETLTVAAGEMTTYRANRPVPVRLTGRAPGLWDPDAGERIEATVTLADNPYGGQVVMCMGDAEGRFTAEVPAAGDFTLQVLAVGADGYALGPRRWAGGQYTDEATVFSLEPGDQAETTLATAGGLVVHALGDPEMEHLWINCYRLDDDWRYWSRSYETSEAVEIINLTPGSYRLRCSGDGLAVPTFHGDVVGFEDSTPVEIRPGEITEITVNMILAGRINGRVTDAAGAPLPATFTLAIHKADEQFVTLRSYNLNYGYDDAFFVYDEDTGEFEIRRLDPGEYRIRILHHHDAWIWYPAAELWDEAEPISVPEGGDSEFIDWQL